MPFRIRALLGFTAVGFVMLGLGLWLAITGPIGTWRFESPTFNRLLGVLLVSGSLSLIVPGTWMLPRCRQPAIESHESHVVIRAVSGRTRTVSWADIRRVSFRPSEVDLRLHSGKRVRVYGQVIDAGGKVAIGEVARFFADRLRPQEARRD